MDSGPNNSFDGHYLRVLMNRLLLEPTAPSPSSFDDLLLDALSALSDDYDDDESAGGRSRLAKEESKLERDIVRVILSGDTASMKPNSGQAVAVGEHHVCVGFHEEDAADYRVWEWHGHIMLFDEEDGFFPEYVYGNYFERLRRGEEMKDKKETAAAEKVGNLGLKELIDVGDAIGNGVAKRVLHRNNNTGSPKLAGPLDEKFGLSQSPEEVLWFLSS